MRTFFLVLVGICLSWPTVSAQQKGICCNPFVELGDDSFKSKKWADAVKYYQEGWNCQDRDECPGLKDKLKAAKDSLRKSLEKEDNYTPPYIPPIEDTPNPYQIEATAWNNLKLSEATPCIIKAQHLSKYPNPFNGTEINTYMKNYDDALWRKVKATNDPNKINDEYINSCPDKSILHHLDDAYEYLGILKNKRDDDALWQLVALEETIDSIELYLNRCAQYGCGHQEEARQRIKEIVYIKTKPKLIKINGGQYQMGNEFEKEEKSYQFKFSEYEMPVHTVILDDFLLGEKEVSFAEYESFCYATGRGRPLDEKNWGKGKMPVVNVSWYDAIEYCNWRSKVDGYDTVYMIEKRPLEYGDEPFKKNWKVEIVPGANGYRLPTEAEWEYAAKLKGKKVRFSNGLNIINATVVNYNANYTSPISTAGEYRNRPIKTGSLPRSEVGIFEMTGNVAEWCWDWFGATYYSNWPRSKDIANNPAGPEQGDTKVVRGGAWNNSPDRCRNSSRNYLKPHGANSTTGFRLARNG